MIKSNTFNKNIINYYLISSYFLFNFFLFILNFFLFGKCHVHTFGTQQVTLLHCFSDSDINILKMGLYYG